MIAVCSSTSLSTEPQVPTFSIAFWLFVIYDVSDHQSPAYIYRHADSAIEWHSLYILVMVCGLKPACLSSSQSGLPNTFASTWSQQTRNICQIDLTTSIIQRRDVKRSSNIWTSKKWFKFKFVFWPFEIRLPNTGWSKFHEISSMSALNSGHRRAINRSKCQTWRCDVTYGWGRCLPALVLAYTVITLRSSLVVITNLRECPVPGHSRRFTLPKCNIRWLDSSQANIATSHQLSTCVASRVLNYLPSAAAGRIS